MHLGHPTNSFGVVLKLLVHFLVPLSTFVCLLGPISKKKCGKLKKTVYFLLGQARATGSEGVLGSADGSLSSYYPVFFFMFILLTVMFIFVNSSSTIACVSIRSITS